jgi:hypothetical protein
MLVFKYQAGQHSPKFPIILPDDPDSEQEIRDGMSGHGIAQAVLSQHEPLKSHAAQNSSNPLIMHKSKYQGGAYKRNWMKSV